MSTPSPIQSSCIIGRPPGLRSSSVSKLYDAPQMESHPKKTRSRYIRIVTQSMLLMKEGEEEDCRMREDARGMG